MYSYIVIRRVLVLPLHTNFFLTRKSAPPKADPSRLVHRARGLWLYAIATESIPKGHFYTSSTPRSDWWDPPSPIVFYGLAIYLFFYGHPTPLIISRNFFSRSQKKKPTFENKPNHNQKPQPRTEHLYRKENSPSRFDIFSFFYNERHNLEFFSSTLHFYARIFRLPAGIRRTSSVELILYLLTSNFHFTFSLLDHKLSLRSRSVRETYPQLWLKKDSRTSLRVSLQIIHLKPKGFPTLPLPRSLTAPYPLPPESASSFVSVVASPSERLVAQDFSLRYPERQQIRR